MMDKFEQFVLTMITEGWEYPDGTSLVEDAKEYVDSRSDLLDALLGLVETDPKGRGFVCTAKSSVDRALQAIAKAEGE